MCPNWTPPLSPRWCFMYNNNNNALFFLSLSLCVRSAYTVLKFMMMWTLVLLADFILEFRLEYLWPCWLFFGSVYTTFHCHGLVRPPAVWFHIACSGPDDDNPTVPFTEINIFFFVLQVICVVFVCAAFTLDIFCLIFVPLHWLFFVASTYVLFNYIWHTGEYVHHCLFRSAFGQTSFLIELN